MDNVLFNDLPRFGDFGGYTNDTLNVIKRQFTVCVIDFLFTLQCKKLHLVEQFFPVVLGHESEESQKSPAEGIKTGVAIVWIPPYF